MVFPLFQFSLLCQSAYCEEVACSKIKLSWKCNYIWEKGNRQLKKNKKQKKTNNNNNNKKKKKKKKTKENKLINLCLHLIETILSRYSLTLITIHEHLMSILIRVDGADRGKNNKVMFMTHCLYDKFLKRYRYITNKKLSQ